MKIGALLLLFILGVTSCCHKNGNSNIITGDYIIVGYTGGFAGDMPLEDYYLINKGQLKKAPMSSFQHVPDDITKFNFSELMPAAKYEAAKDLLTTIPTELLSHTEISVGLQWPDAGYKDVRISINGVVRRWTFQADQSATNPVIRQYLAKLNELNK